MSHNIFPYLETDAKPLTGLEQAVVKDNAMIGIHDGEGPDVEATYPEVLQTRLHGHVQVPEHPLDITAFTGYAIGRRKGQFALPEEIQIPWPQIGNRIAPDFLSGHAWGMDMARGSQDLEVAELIGTVLDSLGVRETSPNDNVILLGRLAGAHAVELGRRQAA